MLVSAEERVDILEAIQAIKSGKQMVFITGAGISVAAKSSAPLTLAILEQKADNAIQSQLSDRRMGCSIPKAKLYLGALLLLRR